MKSLRQEVLDMLNAIGDKADQPADAVTLVFLQGPQLHHGHVGRTAMAPLLGKYAIEKGMALIRAMHPITQLMSDEDVMDFCAEAMLRAQEQEKGRSNDH